MMSEWDKLWEGWGGGYYDHPPIYKVKEVGDKLQDKLKTIENVLSRRHEATIWDYQTTLDVIRELLHTSTQSTIKEGK